MTESNRLRPARRAARASALCLLALGACLLNSREARAQFTTSGTNTTTTNNVAIGTTVPAQNFQVHSPGTYSGTRVTTGATGVTINDGVNFGYDDAYGAYIWNREASPIIFSTSNSEKMRLTPGGNLGIGTTSPGVKFVLSRNAANPLAPNPADPLAPQDGTILHIVNADAQKTRVTIDSFGASTGPSVAFRAGRGTMAAPTATLAGDALGIVYGGGFGPTRFHAEAKPSVWMVATENWTDTAAGSAIYFRTVQNGTTASVERMRVSGDGNVGIGTTAPAAKLHVAGNIVVDGNINAKYQDVAEWVPSTQKLAAGTVVILDASRGNHVLASHGAYDTRVAGVISAQPGLSLGEQGEGKVLVATTGRVKVKVDATKSPIKIGDLIVTSEVEGVAMKSEPVSLVGVALHRPGTLIGKALESLEKGTGEILILLSLQ